MPNLSVVHMHGSAKGYLCLRCNRTHLFSSGIGKRHAEYDYNVLDAKHEKARAHPSPPPPPSCPKCGTALRRVVERVYEHYEWDPFTLGYVEDARAGWLVIDCPECGYELNDVPGFQDGVCNYAPPEPKEKEP